MATEAPTGAAPVSTVVTGATGFAGRHLLARLTGTTALVGWARIDGTEAQGTPGLTWASVELGDRASLDRAIRASPPIRLFHLAGAANVAASFDGAVSHLRANALGTHHLLQAIRAEAPGCRVLVVTSAQVYAASERPLNEDSALGPDSPYGVTKLAQDRIAAAAAADGLDVVLARPFNHIGPGQQPAYAIAAFARQIALAEAGLASPVLRVGNLDSRRDITDVRDVVAAYVLLAERGRRGRPYNVCSGSTHRIGDLLEMLRAMSSVAIEVEIDPERFRPVDVPVIQGDVRRIRDEVGWAPRIPIEQTLADTLDDWRQRVSRRMDGEPSNSPGRPT